MSGAWETEMPRHDLIGYTKIEVTLPAASIFSLTAFSLLVDSVQVQLLLMLSIVFAWLICIIRVIKSRAITIYEDKGYKNKLFTLINLSYIQIFLFDQHPSFFFSCHYAMEKSVQNFAPTSQINFSSQSTWPKIGPSFYFVLFISKEVCAQAEKHRTVPATYESWRIGRWGSQAADYIKKKKIKFYKQHRCLWKWHLAVA